MSFKRKHFNMDMDWRFHRGDVEIDWGKGHADVYRSTKSGGGRGPATKRAYDDSRWERVNLPHDYMREAAYSPDEMHLESSDTGIRPSLASIFSPLSPKSFAFISALAL